MKSFSHWTIEEVENEFGIGPRKTSKRFDEWMNVKTPPSSFEAEWLESIRADVELYSYTWNEQELIASCIAPVLRLVNFQQDVYRAFLERELSVPYKDETLSGEVDYMVAQGRHSPQRPFFFLHEYKRELEQKDPRGQLLIAMIAAQLLNQDQSPLYGVYVVGSIWRFILLEEKAYIVHRGLNAASDEIVHIFGVLQNTKTIIEELIGIRG
ncbi:MAG: hypothetical protein AAF702_12835 [Chloroflexota bacterium]